MSNYKILIVEDELIEAMNFEQYLTSFGYDVIGIVSTGKDAISKVAEHNPDLVLMDIILKGEMDGIEAATQIREEYDVPIVYLTAHPEESAVNRAKHTSPYGYLIKPVNKTDLKNTIELAVYKHLMENKLKESEEKYRTLFDNPLDMITLSEAPEKSSPRKFIEVNKIATERLGYTRDEFLNMTPTDIVAPEKRSQIPQITKNLKKHGYDKFESIHQSKDGKKIPVEIYNHKFELKGKNVVLAVSRDITGRKNAETALQEREEFLSGILNDMTTFVAILNLDGEIIFVNNTPLKLIEKNLEDIKGMMFYDVDWWTFSKETIHKLKQHIKLCASGETVEYETQIQTLHGLTWIDYSMHPVFDEKKKVKYLVAEGRNITQHKKTEKALLDSEEKYREVFNKSNDAMTLALVNDDGSLGHYLEVNDVMCRELGYTREELLKMTPKDIVSPDFWDEMPQNATKLFADGNATFESVHISKNGHKRPVEISAYMFILKGKKVSIASIRDLTERKKAENKLKTSLREKELLLREIHHRVKNNLQIISSLLDLQEDYVKEDPTAVNVLHESQNRVISMAIIHEMLYQSRDLGEISFSEYMNSLISQLFGSYGATAITSIVNVEDVCLNIETAVPCGLIISELVSNSLKYAFPEGKPGEILIALNSQKEGYELVISDNGVGFPQELDFRNVKSSLGLQLVNTLVNQLDGSIELDRNQGTKFNIIFNELEYKERI